MARAKEKTIKWLKMNQHIKQADIKKGIVEDTQQAIKEDATKLFKKANRQINQINRSKSVISPALDALKEKGIKQFRISNNLNETQKLYEIAQEFLNAETGTLKGARNYSNKLRNQLNLKRGERLDKTFINDIFDALHALHERMPDVLYAGQLAYAQYLDTVVQVAEDMELSNFNSAERVEQTVTAAIDKLTTQVTDMINDDIDKVNHMLFDTKLF